MNDQLAKRLFDAHQAALRIEAITREMDFAGYQSAEVTRLAVERLLEIVGEALAASMRLDPALRERFPDFREAVGLRNRIIHGYDDINNVIIWDIVQTNIPSVINQLEAVLRNAPQGE